MKTTIPHLIKHNSDNYSDEIAIREKKFGIWSGFGDDRGCYQWPLYLKGVWNGVETTSTCDFLI